MSLVKALAISMCAKSLNGQKTSYSKQQFEYQVSLTEKAKDKLDDCQCELTQSKNDLNNAKDKADESERKLDKVKAEKDESEREYEQKLDESQKNLEKVKEKLEKSESENEELDDQLKKSGQDLDEAHSELDEVNKDLEETQCELDKCDADVKKCDANSQKMEEDLCTVKDELEEIKDAFGCVQAELQECEERTPAPTTAAPTTAAPTGAPTGSPTGIPSASPSAAPTGAPTETKESCEDFKNCHSFFDGCNNCECTEDGDLCTKMYCDPASYGTPKCNACKNRFSFDADGQCVASSPCGGDQKCTVYDDGCNICICKAGSVTQCTDRMCFVQGEAECMLCDNGSPNSDTGLCPGA